MLHAVNPDITAAAIRGAGEIERRDDRLVIRRLPDWTSIQYADVTIETGASWLSGVRLELETAATLLELRVHFHRLQFEAAGMPLRPAAVTVEADGELQHFAFDEGDVLRVDSDWTALQALGVTSVVRAQTDRHDVPRRVTVWLPHNCAAEIVSLSADAPVAASTREAPRWVHYGSSISNASEADNPTGVWPAIVARKLGLDLYNIALPGNAQLDGFAARTIRDTPASLITLKVGINLVNAGSMVQRTFIPAVHAFLDTVREGHPSTPIVLISPIFCAPHEAAPGPTIFRDGRATSGHNSSDPIPGALTLAGIRDAMREIVAKRCKSDSFLTYWDGLTLLGPGDAARLPDALHPDAEGYRLIASNFIDQFEPLLPYVGKTGGGPAQLNTAS